MHWDSPIYFFFLVIGHKQEISWGRKMVTRQVDKVFADSSLVSRYVVFRPEPPLTLVDRVVQHCKKKKGTGELGLCVDIGCGSGQSTQQFAPFFASVVGIDISEEQLQVARDSCQWSNISFRVGQAEALPFADFSVDLVTVCAAVHWFDIELFYEEVRRVLKDGGVLAVYGYLGTTPVYRGVNLRTTFMQIWETVKYWPKGHDHLVSEYAELPPCFIDDLHIGTKEGHFAVEIESTLDDVLGYISSLSAFGKYEQLEGDAKAQLLLQQAKDKLLSAMGPDARVTDTFTRRYDYFLRMWAKDAV